MIKNVVDNDVPYCCYCGEKIIFASQRTKEHLIPRSKGGNNSGHNKRDCCWKCNNERGNKDLADWISRLRTDLSNKKLNIVARYRKEAQLYNAEYWLHYIESAGNRLYKFQNAG